MFMLLFHCSIYYFHFCVQDKRYSEFVTTKKKITELYDLLDFEPDTSFGCELICEDDDSFGLSTENMDKLRNLHNEVCN